MDWSLVTARLFDRFIEPALLVDERRRIVRVNRAAAASLGWLQGEMEGQPMHHFLRLGTQHGGQEGEEKVRNATGGEIVRCMARVRTSPGYWVRLRAEVHVFGDSDAVLLIELHTPATSRSTVPPARVHASPMHRADPDMLRFDVDTSPERFGTITRIESSAPSTAVGRKCHEVIFGHTRPCPRCPIKERPPADSQTNTAVHHRDGYYYVVRSRSVEPDIAHISWRRLTDALVRQLASARLEALAEKADLSERERAVLHLLILGRSLDDIAGALGISNRTVRFHQGNLLRKLGAESRLDLARLLL